MIIYCCIAFGVVLFSSCAKSANSTPPPKQTFPASNFFTDPKVVELAEAAVIGDIKRIETLVSRGVDVNSKGKKGMTPLIYTVFLMAKRQDYEDSVGVPPPLKECPKTSIEGFQHLLILGADPNMQQTEWGQSAISYASYLRKSSEYLKLVIAHGGNPNIRRQVPLNTPTSTYPNTEPTPIYDAINGRSSENAQILIKAGADVSNVRNSYGWTPLMSAAVIKSFGVMYVLLEADADFSAKDPMGYSVANYLLESEVYNPKSKSFKSRKKCFEFMEKKGIDFEEEALKAAEIDRQRDENPSSSSRYHERAGCASPAKLYNRQEG